MREDSHCGLLENSADDLSESDENEEELTGAGLDTSTIFFDVLRHGCLGSVKGIFSLSRTSPSLEETLHIKGGGLLGRMKENVDVLPEEGGYCRHFF